MKIFRVWSFLLVTETPSPDHVEELLFSKLGFFLYVSKLPYNNKFKRNFFKVKFMQYELQFHERKLEIV